MWSKQHASDSPRVKLKLQSHHSTFRHPSPCCDQCLCRQCVHALTVPLRHPNVSARISDVMRVVRNCSLPNEISAALFIGPGWKKKEKSLFYFYRGQLLLRSHKAHSVSAWKLIAGWLWYEALCSRSILALQHCTKQVLSQKDTFYVSSVAALKVPEVHPHAHLLQVDIKIKVTASVGAQFKGIQKPPWGEVTSQWQTHWKGSIPVQCRLFQFQSDL